ncbi:MAG: hypothetical protein NWP83_09735, partial [Spirosomaceae bacterium]|nr:hypothetical protein [Spirosomataceae bacterium]
KYISLLSEEEKQASSVQVATVYNYLAGKAFNIEKDTQKAMDYVNQALKYDPTNERALYLMESLMPTDGGTMDSSGTTPAQTGNSGKR